MKKTALLFFLSILFVSSSVLQAQGELTTVLYVDLNKYKGIWYEAAKIPNFFQRNCVKGTTAEYLLASDGTITVRNSCYEADGEQNMTEGIAKVSDPKSNAKLQVSFFSILGWRPVWGDYWVIGLASDYSYAVVGTPSRKYGWVLSRVFPMPEPKLKEAYDILKRSGYDISKFTVNAQ